MPSVFRFRFYRYLHFYVCGFFPVLFVAAPVVHKGDSVTVEATLSTSDPNENGEGEPLILQSSGGFSATISNYEQTRSFSSVATVDGETVTSFIGGYDGDETSSVNINVNQKRRFTDAQKAALAKASADLNTDAAALSVVAATCLFLPDPSVTKVCAFGGGLSAGAVWVLSGILNQLALDPADPNYTAIASPLFPALEMLVAQQGITQAEADAFNALLLNQERAIGYGRAIVTSINRADGAFAAGDAYWENQQMQAAAQYALQLSTLLNLQPTLRSTLQSALQGAGFPVISITPNDVYNFEVNVLYGTLPAYLVNALTQLGADATDIEHIRRLAYVQDINLVAGSFPSLLTNRPSSISILAAAQSLTEFAIDNGTPLVLGQEAEGEGFIVPASGGKITFEFEAKVEDDHGGELRGKLRLQDHGAGLGVRSTALRRAVLIGNLVAIDGDYEANDGTAGTFRAIAADNAKHGKGKDAFSLTLSNGYQASGILAGGNIEIKTRAKSDN